MPDTPDTPEVEDLIRYDVLAQEALRSVVKKVLQEVARTGLPGEHHFFITFDTNYAGVRLSNRMKEKYPEEMTIVVQHQYWDLEATDVGFSIGLSFDNIPETMRVPYAAIQGFFDPAVQFGLQFDADPGELDGSDDLELLDLDEEDENGEKEGNVSALPAPKKVERLEKPKSKAKKKSKPKAKSKAKSQDDDAAEEDGTPSADVVSLDAFRKK